MANYTLRGEKCSICGQRMAVSNRTGAHNACILSLRFKAKAERENADADAFLCGRVALETAPPWVRHPVAWDNVRATR